MATFSIEVPDEQVGLIVDSFVEAYPAYDGKPDDMAAKSEWTRARVIDFIEMTVRGAQLAKAQAAALETHAQAAPLSIT